MAVIAVDLTTAPITVEVAQNLIAVASTGAPGPPGPPGVDGETLASQGNLLTEAQAGCTGGWTSSGTLVYGTDGSMVVTTAGTSPVSVYATCPVTVGATYTATSTLTTVGRTALLLFKFRNASAAAIGADIVGNTIAAGGTGVSTATAIAPAGAVDAVVYAVYTGSGAIGDTVQMRQPGLWRGAGGDWAMPGVPIVNQGFRTTHPNGEDVLTEVWDASKSRWQQTYYASSRRNVSNLVTDPKYLGAGDGTIRLTRENSSVELEISLNAGAMPTGSVVVFPIPEGFRPSWIYLPNGAWYTNSQVTGVTAAYVSGNNLIVNRGSLTTTNLRGLMRWTTVDARPTSLPGTLVTPAPA